MSGEVGAGGWQGRIQVGDRVHIIDEHEGIESWQIVKSVEPCFAPEYEHGSGARWHGPTARTHATFTQAGGGCWIWTGRMSRGVPVVVVDGKRRVVRRWMYELEHGPISRNVGVRQQCGNAACVNPDHSILTNGLLYPKM